MPEKNSEKRVDLDIVVKNLLEIYPPLLKKINTGDYMQEYRLTPNLCRILFILQSDEMLSLSELSQRMAMNRSNCSRAVEKLSEKDLVKRETDPSDRRRTLLKLSENGQKRVENLRLYIREEIKEHLAELSTSDIEVLKKASEDIHEVLSKLN